MQNKMKAISRFDNKGVTLVELLVAGIITALAISGLVALLMKGRDIDTMDKHRRQARVIIMARFESSTYNYLNFSKIGNTITDSTVTLDSRQGSALTGTLSGTIVNSTVGIVPTKQITLRVSWTEHKGAAQNVELVKWLSQAQ